MAIDAFPWPTPEDYTTTLQNLPQLAEDPRLRTAQVEHDFAGNIKQHSGAGLYTCNFKVTLDPSRESPSGKWMMRCFCSTQRGKPPQDIRERYREISAFCNANLDRVSALLPLNYIDKAIHVYPEDEETGNLLVNKGVLVPIAMMPFVEDALPLGTYIAMHYRSRQEMEDLCRAWFVMLREMHEAQAAHGDLDLTNVLVLSKSGLPTLKLIDYDNMWIKAINHLPQTELGHEGFQHPALMANRSRPYNATMDRFAALSIYISMRALSLYPHLYEECGANDLDRLLFSRVDYKREIEHAYVGVPSEAEASTITKLYNRGEAVLMPYLNALRYALYYDCMPEYDLFSVPTDYGMYGIPLPGGGMFTPSTETPKAASRTQWVPPKTPTTALPSTQPITDFVPNTSSPAQTPRDTSSAGDHEDEGGALLSPPYPYVPPSRRIPAWVIIVAVVLLVALLIGIILFVNAHQAQHPQQGLHAVELALHSWGARHGASVEWSFV